MHFLVRLDDITQYMDRSKFEAVRGILDEYGIKPIIGVVPECRDSSISVSNSISDKSVSYYSESEYKKLLDELTSSGWILAQHGTYHVYDTDNSGLLGINSFSEFAGLPYEAQYEKLKVGRDILRESGYDPTLFMAPGHSFDRNTLKALRELGFFAVTDGLYHQPYIRDDILFIPCTLVAYDKMKGIDTVCLHTNQMNNNDISALENFIKTHKSEALTYNSDFLRSIAITYSSKIATAESNNLKKRNAKNKIAHSGRISAYLSYTDHKNKYLKWIKRIIMIPIIFSDLEHKGKKSSGR